MFCIVLNNKVFKYFLRMCNNQTSCEILGMKKNQTGKVLGLCVHPVHWGRYTNKKYETSIVLISALIGDMRAKLEALIGDMRANQETGGWVRVESKNTLR